MHWTKIGFIFSPEHHSKLQTSDWMHHSATVPVPLHLYDDIFRVYFSSRNKFEKNQIGYLEIDLTDPTNVFNISENPVLKLGRLGYFDCDGLYGTSIIKNNNELLFYYAGWNSGKDGVFYSSIGMATSHDGGISFEKHLEVPVLNRNIYSKWAVMAPFVLKDDDDWKMYHTSGIEMYRDDNNHLKSFYNIKVAISKDGFKWIPTKDICIDLHDDITNIARPCVIKEDGLYKCWFPYVSSQIRQYRIGYAESKDGAKFDIKKKDILSLGNKGDFDSIAVTYPYVFDHKGERYMLYNGNEFGKTGFGLAKEIKVFT